MSTRIYFGATPKFWTPSPGGRVASSASNPGTEPPMDHDITPRAYAFQLSPEPTAQPMKDADLPIPSTHYRAPTASEHLNGLAGTSRWQQDLDRYFANVFQESISLLTERAVDDAVACALQIIEYPSQAKIRALALGVWTHWTRMQLRCENANVHPPKIVALVLRMADHLGRISIHARKDFLDELDHLCIEQLKRTWRLYVAVVIRGVSPVLRKSLFTRVMTVVAMIGYLFRGDQLRYGAVLDVLGYIATMSPWLDAATVIYALLHELGPKFALERAGWYFIQHVLAELHSFTMRRVHEDPLCQLVSAIETLVSEWDNATRVTLYQTHPKGNN